MSYKLTAEALSIKTGSPMTKLVLLALCDYANDKNECWPSQMGIALKCEMSERTVIRHIESLIAKDILKKKKSVGSRNKYKISLSQGQRVSSDRESVLTECRTDRESCSSDRVSPQSTDRVSPKPISIEPTINQVQENWLKSANSVYLDFCKNYYQMLSDNKKITKSVNWKTKAWYDSCRLLVEKDEIKIDELYSMLKFLDDNLLEKYCPQVWSMSAFRDKWIKLSDFKARQTSNNQQQGTPSNDFFPNPI